MFMSYKSRVGTRSQCSVCGDEKIISFEFTSESNPGLNRYYCKDCYEYSKERIACSNCGMEISREDMAKHKLDIHTD